MADEQESASKSLWGKPLAERGNPDDYVSLRPLPIERKYRGRVLVRGDGPKEKRDRHLRRMYGITLAQYEEMYLAQSGKCAICGREEVTRGGRHGTTPIRLAVDHNHETGRVNALLCRTCNTAIGNFLHSIALMEKAIDYLEVCDYSRRTLDE